MPKMVQEIKEAYANAMGYLAKQAKTPGFPGKCLKKGRQSGSEDYGIPFDCAKTNVLHDKGWTRIGQCCERTGWTDG